MNKVRRYPYYIGFSVDKQTHQRLFERYKRWLKNEHRINLDKTEDIAMLRKRNSQTNFSTFMRTLVNKALDWGVL